MCWRRGRKQSSSAKRQWGHLKNWQLVSFQRLLQKAGLQGNKKHSSHTAIRRNPANLLEALCMMCITCLDFHPL